MPQTGPHARTCVRVSLLRSVHLQLMQDEMRNLKREYRRAQVLLSFPARLLPRVARRPNELMCLCLCAFVLPLGRRK